MTIRRIEIHFITCDKCGALGPRIEDRWIGGPLDGVLARDAASQAGFHVEEGDGAVDLCPACVKRRGKWGPKSKQVKAPAPARRPATNEAVHGQGPYDDGTLHVGLNSSIDAQAPIAGPAPTVESLDEAIALADRAFNGWEDELDRSFQRTKHAHDHSMADEDGDRLADALLDDGVWPDEP